MTRIRALWSRTRGLIALALGIAAIGLPIYLIFYGPERSKLIPATTLTAGSAQGMRHEFAKALREEAIRKGLQIIIVETRGSEDSLEKVNNGSIGVALVQGGLNLTQRANVRQVAALNIEPLHLLVKPELQATTDKGLSSLRGKSINLSDPLSGTNLLARDVLAFAGLKNPGLDYKPLTLSYDQLKSIDNLAELPDAVFLISSAPAPIALHLIEKWGYRLVPLPFAEAFTLRSSQRLGGPKAIDHTQVYPTTIPAYSYGLEPSVPDRDLATFGTRLLMVAHKDLDPAIIDRLLTTTFYSRFAHIPHPSLEPSLLKINAELDLHQGTTAFLQRNEPLIAGDVLDYMDKLKNVAGPVLGGLLLVGHWLWRTIRRRRDLGFEAYIQQVTEVEARVLESEQSATMDLKTLLGLQSELARIKSDALEKFTNGEIDGEVLMSGFLTHVHEARNYLARLILHERENFEARAKETRQTPEALWHQEVEEHD